MRVAENVGERPILQAEEVTKRYDGMVAVSRVSLQVAEVEIFGLVGPNGAGKTTLIECLEGLRVPDAGEVRAPRGAGYAVLGHRLAHTVDWVLRGSSTNPCLAPGIRALARPTSWGWLIVGAMFTLRWFRWE